MNKILLRTSITLALAAANALMWGNIIKGDIQRSKETKKRIRNDAIMKHNMQCIRAGSPGLRELEI